MPSCEAQPPLTAAVLIRRIRKAFRGLPDVRTGATIKAQ
jgi:hypothetical protein